jgi:hypothetical protein
MKVDAEGRLHGPTGGSSFTGGDDEDDNEQDGQEIG